MKRVDVAAVNHSMYKEIEHCWQCKTDIAEMALFCHKCGVIQQPKAINPFERLQMPMAVEIDLPLLEKKYLLLQSKLHPDRFIQKSAEERKLAHEWGVYLNHAYQTLKDPLKRFQILIDILRGETKKTTQPLDPDILEDIFDLKFKLEIDATLKATLDAKVTAKTEAFARAFFEKDIALMEQILQELSYYIKMSKERV